MKKQTYMEDDDELLSPKSSNKSIFEVAVDDATTGLDVDIIISGVVVAFEFELSVFTALFNRI